MKSRSTVLALIAVFNSSSVVTAVSAKALVPPRPISWQSAGDSYSSGEGVYGNVGDCAQSKSAYGPLAASALRAKGWNIAPETFTACTGHFIEDYFNARTDSGGKASLWDWGVQQGGTDRVDVLTMSFGGNDIGFANLLVDCLPTPDSWTEFILIGPTSIINLSGCDFSQEEIEGRIDALLDPPARDCSGLRRTGQAGSGCDLDIGDRRGSIIDFFYDLVVDRLTESGALYVVGYPRLFAPVNQWPGWLKVNCQGVLRGDTEKLGRIADHLNAKLSEAVDRANQALGTNRVHFLDRLALYRDGKHELCGTEDDWLNGVAFNRGDGLGLRKETSFHPNAAGHLAIAHELATTIQETLRITATSIADPEPPICASPACISALPMPSSDGCSVVESFDIKAVSGWDELDYDFAPLLVFGVDVQTGSIDLVRSREQGVVYFIRNWQVVATKQLYNADGIQALDSLYRSATATWLSAGSAWTSQSVDAFLLEDCLIGTGPFDWG